MNSIKYPSNMSQDEAVAIMIKVSNRMGPAYTFYGYDVEDMQQEGFLLCVEALEKYDGIRPLENFLANYLYCRLRNFIRAQHFDKNSSESRRRIKMPGQLSNENDTYTYESEILEKLVKAELFEVMSEGVSSKNRPTYLKILADVKVGGEERIALYEELREILGVEVAYGEPA